MASTVIRIKCQLFIIGCLQGPLWSDFAHDSKLFPASQLFYLLSPGLEPSPPLYSCMAGFFSPVRALLKCHLLRETQLKQLISISSSLIFSLPSVSCSYHNCRVVLFFFCLLVDLVYLLYQHVLWDSEYVCLGQCLPMSITEPGIE